MTLNEKAIDIHGKKYVLVSDRVLAFNESYSNGCITTELVKYDTQVIIKATVTPDTKELERTFTGYAQETIGGSGVNKTSALENAETSAVGRALAMMGIGVIDSIASVDEINKSKNSTPVINYDTQENTLKCHKCGSEMVTNPKTGKTFCKEKCWLK